MKHQFDKSNKFNVTLGTDPEVFFENNVECVSAEGIVPGTKQDPYYISEKGHAIQLDNVSAEFNIPPVSSREEWVEEILIPLNYLREMAQNNNLSVSSKASAVFNEKYLQTENAKEFGCSPDYNVYLQDLNPKPMAENSALRSCGGHVAIGYEDQDIDKTEEIVKLFDLFVVLPSMLIDKDERRRELYGKAGAFRFTPFGLECRSLSNFWLGSEDLMKWVFDQTMIAVNIVLENNSKYYIDTYSKNVEKAINSGDRELALEIVKELGIDLV